MLISSSFKHTVYDSPSLPITPTKQFFFIFFFFLVYLQKQSAPEVFKSAKLFPSMAPHTQQFGSL